MHAPEPHWRQEDGVETVEWAIFGLVVVVLGTLAWKLVGSLAPAGLGEIF